MGQGVLQHHRRARLTSVTALQTDENSMMVPSAPSKIPSKVCSQEIDHLQAEIKARESEIYSLATDNIALDAFLTTLRHEWRRTSGASCSPDTTRAAAGSADRAAKWALLNAALGGQGVPQGQPLRHGVNVGSASRTAPAARERADPLGGSLNVLNNASTQPLTPCTGLSQLVRSAASRFKPAWPCSRYAR